MYMYLCKNRHEIAYLRYFLKVKVRKRNTFWHVTVPKEVK